MASSQYHKNLKFSVIAHENNTKLYVNGSSNHNGKMFTSGSEIGLP
jgi:hypothetical protein